jgi:hypothetical protein
MPVHPQALGPSGRVTVRAGAWPGLVDRLAGREEVVAA